MTPIALRNAHSIRIPRDMCISAFFAHGKMKRKHSGNKLAYKHGPGAHEEWVATNAIGAPRPCRMHLQIDQPDAAPLDPSNELTELFDRLDGRLWGTAVLATIASCRLH